MARSDNVPVHDSGFGKPNFPDITFNPNPRTHIPYSTHSVAVAKLLAKNRSSDVVTRALRTKGD